MQVRLCPIHDRDNADQKTVLEVVIYNPIEGGDGIEETDRLVDVRPRNQRPLNSG